MTINPMREEFWALRNVAGRAVFVVVLLVSQLLAAVLSGAPQ